MEDSKFKISTNVAMPHVTRGVRETYPFDALPAPTEQKDAKGNIVKDEKGNPVMVYASFPVAKAAKTMQSTIYSAMRRYAKVEKDKDGKEKIVEKVREFRCLNVDPTADPDGAISRVFRVK